MASARLPNSQGSSQSKPWQKQVLCRYVWFAKNKTFAKRQLFSIYVLGCKSYLQSHCTNFFFLCERSWNTLLEMKKTDRYLEHWSILKKKVSFIHDGANRFDLIWLCHDVLVSFSRTIYFWIIAYAVILKLPFFMLQCYRTWALANAIDVTTKIIQIHSFFN